MSRRSRPFGDLFGESLRPLQVVGSAHTPVFGVSADTRTLEPGDVFVCIRGSRFDGHEFIPKALAQGAIGIVVEREDVLGRIPAGVVGAALPDTRAGLPILAARFHDHPARHLRLVGVTGTNGKTSACLMIDSIAAAAGLRTGRMTTVEIRWGDGRLDAVRTTPEASDNQRILRRMVDDGVELATLEVSSHALALHRVEGCEFDAAVFTNLTQDHLDFHADLEEYFSAKAGLFTGRYAGSKSLVGVVNLDDPYGRRLLDVGECSRWVTYGSSAGADVQAREIRIHRDGTHVAADTPAGEIEVDLKLRGGFSAFNGLAALATGIALGFDLEAVRRGLEAVAAVPGRLEFVGGARGPLVFVDYAHTPAGLENVLSSVRQMTSGQVIVVFGCGGDRDRGKRPKMGAIASQMADYAIVTSDNPRSEDPEAIIGEILRGMDANSFEVIADRRSAIERALDLAGEDDLVLVAGKGHETYQIFADRTIPFDDREVAREAVKRREQGTGNRELG